MPCSVEKGVRDSSLEISTKLQFFTREFDSDDVLIVRQIF